MARRWLAVALVGSLVAVFAACGGDDGGGGVIEGATTDEQVDQEREDVKDAREGDQATTSEEELPYQETIELSLEDIQAFWAEELPVAYGIEYTQLTDAQIIPYDETTDPSEYSECFADASSYEDVADNAFYCALDQTVSYDDQGLFPDLYDRFGPFALAMVLAHEWGHAVQDQTYGLIDLNQSQPTVFTETQADCFAGAWADWVNDERSPTLILEAGDLDVGVVGMLSFADPIGTSPDEQGAHGAGFDRVLAFQRGFNQGAASCFEWDVNPPQIVEVPFNDEQDAAQGGNAPLVDLLEFVPTDLDVYWAQVAESAGATYDGVDDVVPVDPDASADACSSTENEDIAGEVLYCESDDTIVYDESLVDVVYNDIGDFGVAVLLSNAWANAMQDELELSSTDSLELGLQADCFSGAWTGSIAFQLHATDILLSPGDLDEVVQAFILYGDQAEIRGSGFDRVQQFAQAFFSETAEADCAAITEG